MSKRIPTIQVQSDQSSLGPRHQSLDGRFTIIDEQSKDSDSFDETSSDNDDSADQVQFSNSGSFKRDVLCSSPNLPHLNYSISQPSKMSTLGVNNSRFRVVPVEAKYQRKRWLVWDWFDASDVNTNQSAIAGTLVRDAYSQPQTPTTVASKPIFHLTPPPKRALHKSKSARTAPLATPEPMSTTSFNFSDSDQDQENSLPTSFDKNQITVRQMESAESHATNLAELQDELRNSRHLSTSGIMPLMAAGRISPSEMLNQYGLERSLSATSYSSPRCVTTTSQLKPNSLSPDRIPYSNESSTGVVSAANHVPHSATNVHAQIHGSTILAIDNKIEQDLVKAHLMFAVKEEVEHLRSRITSLETTVAHLEAENSILRDHVSNDVLQTLSLQSTSSNHGATAMT